MKEYEFRGRLIELLANMLYNVWYVRLDLLIYQKCYWKGNKIHTGKYNNKIDWKKWDDLHSGHQKWE